MIHGIPFLGVYLPLLKDEVLALNERMHGW